MTQKEAGQLLNTTQQQYAKYELGIQEIPVHHLLTLAEYYRVSTDYMLERAEWIDSELQKEWMRLDAKQKRKLLQQMKQNSME